jgi:hypothetical protein
MKTSVLATPHKQAWLPNGKPVVNVFFNGDIGLKVVKDGANGDARFRNQHCLPGGVKSTLARSTYLDHASDVAVTEFFCDDLAPGFYGELASDWKSKALSRVDFYIDANVETGSVRLLEVFYQCRLHPIFVEGN